MDPSSVFGHLGAPVFVLLLSAILGFAGAVLCGVMLVQGRRVSPALAAAGVALPGVVGGVAAVLALGGADAEAAVGGALGYRLITVLFAAPAAFFLLVLAAIAGVRAPPRQIPWAAGAAAGAFAVPLVVVIGGHAYGDPLFAWVRAAGYLALGLIVAVAWSAGDAHDDASGLEAAASAGLGWALIVALGEVSARGMVLLFLTFNLAAQPVDSQQAFVDAALADVADPRLPWYLAAMGLAGLVGAIGCLRLARARGPVALVGLVWVIAAPALFFLGDAGAADLSRLVVPAAGAPSD